MKTRSYRQKRRRRQCFLAAAALAAAAFGVLLWWMQGRNIAQHEPDNVTYLGSIPIHHDFLDKEAAGRPGEKREILHVVIHETDNFNEGSDAKAHNGFIHLNGMTESLSWHYTVDDHSIYHHLPDDETAYHASDRMEEGGGNKNGIGIEMCVNADGDYEKTLENTVQLAAFLLTEHGLTIDDLKKHEDFSGKICPARLIEEGRWDEFVSRVHARVTEIEREQAADT